MRALRTIQFGGMTEQMTMNWVVPFLWNIGSMMALFAWYFKTYRCVLVCMMIATLLRRVLRENA